MTATVTYTERNFLYEKLRVRVTRAGRTALDAPIQRLGCPDCANDRPSAVKVRDLDGGEPEVLVDLYSGGAHCCLFTLILRWDAAAQRYRSTLGVLGQLRRRGWPISTATAGPSSPPSTSASSTSSPPTSSRRRRSGSGATGQGKLVDVTRSFPALIQKSAATNLGYYLKGRGDPNTDVRSYVAAYVADQYLLGDPAEGKRVLDLALKRGDLGRGTTLPRAARRQGVRRGADAGPAQVGVHPLLVRPRTIDALLGEARAGLARLTPEQACAAWQEGALLVDTRSADEQREQGGVIPGALRHPLSVVLWRLDELPGTPA